MKINLPCPAVSYVGQLKPERERERGKVGGSKRVDYDNDKQPIGLHSVTCSQLPDRPAAIAQHAM